MRALHLVTRFFGSFVARRLSPPERAFVDAALTPAELDVFIRMGRADQREGYETALRAELALSEIGRSDPQWLAAALLHDVGKTDARFGPIRRAMATVIGAVGGEGVLAWRRSRFDAARRIADYLLHAANGSDQLARAGGRDAAIRWARVHHQPDDWNGAGIPADIGKVLARADGERVRKLT